jgi:hypothetical protein
MDQERNPRFSHIAIGGLKPNTANAPEAEEVITIGATDAPAAAPSIPSVILGNAKDPAEEARAGTDVASLPQAPPPAIDDDLGGPMPLPQKITLIVCLLGLIIAIVFIVKYWLA